MKKSRWSPADLDRQRLAVRRITQRCEFDLRAFEAARNRLLAAIYRQIGVPLALGSCFIAGVMAVPGRPRQGEAGPQQRRAGRLRQVVTFLLRTFALAAAGGNTLFRSNLRSGEKVRGRSAGSLSIRTRRDGNDAK